jgi:cell division protein FtsB
MSSSSSVSASTVLHIEDLMLKSTMSMDDDEIFFSRLISAAYDDDDSRNSSYESLLVSTNLDVDLLYLRNKVLAKINNPVFPIDWIDNLTFSNNDITDNSNSDALIAIMETQSADSSITNFLKGLRCNNTIMSRRKFIMVSHRFLSHLVDKGFVDNNVNLFISAPPAPLAALTTSIVTPVAPAAAPAAAPATVTAVVTPAPATVTAVVTPAAAPAVTPAAAPAAAPAPAVVTPDDLNSQANFIKMNARANIHSILIDLFNENNYLLMEYRKLYDYNEQIMAQNVEHVRVITLYNSTRSPTPHKKNDTLIAENESLKQTVTDMTAENESLKQTVTDMTAENESLKQTVASMTTGKNSLVAEKNSLIAKNDTLTAEKKSLLADIQSLKQTVTDMTAENKSLEQTVTDMTADIQSLTAENESLTAENESLTAENGTLTAKNESLEQTVIDMTAEKKSLVAEKDTLTAEKVSNAKNTNRYRSILVDIFSIHEVHTIIDTPSGDASVTFSTTSVSEFQKLSKNFDALS